MTDRVLVLDAQARNALAVIRSLGRHGLRVTGAEETRFAPGLYSKFCHDRFIYPPPNERPRAFIEALIKNVRENRYSAIYPIADATVRPVALHYDEISRETNIGFPPPEILNQAMDKRQTIRLARQVGIPHPRTFLVGEDGTLEEAIRDLAFPLVLKPAVGFGSRGLSIVGSVSDLREHYRETVERHGATLIQEFIPRQSEVGVYVLLDRSSELRAFTVHRRLRSYPVSGGPSTLRETIRCPEAVELAKVLLTRMGWWGVAVVEFRIDSRDGSLRLMEVNPRFGGSLQLSILAGVDFPFLLHRLLMTGNVETIPDYKTGVRCRWLVPGDMLHFLSAPNKLELLPEFLKVYERGTGHDTFSLSDPVPSLALLATILRFSFSRKMWSFVIRKPEAPARSTVMEP